MWSGVIIFCVYMLGCQHVTISRRFLDWSLRQSNGKLIGSWHVTLPRVLLIVLVLGSKTPRLQALRPGKSDRALIRARRVDPTPPSC